LGDSIQFFDFFRYGEKNNEKTVSAAEASLRDLPQHLVVNVTGSKSNDTGMMIEFLSADNFEQYQTKYSILPE